MLLYFFRKKIAFCNHYGLYTILGLYAVTFVRMALPFEFGFTNTISDHSFYPVVIDALTPDKKNFFVPEFTWLNLIFTIWIAVSVILIIRAIYKYHKAIKILKKTVIEPKPELQAQLDAVAKQCKIKSMVKLRISDSISSPVTYGFIKPVVLFSNQTFTNEEFNFIATHECCHIKNKDIWIKLLTEIYCGIFWWNPLVYLLKKGLSFCLELRCDKRVTKALDDYERCNYGQVLVTELKKCYEEENSDKQNECNLKSALIGMNFASIEKNKKNIHRMEMILYPNKKQTIKNTFITAFAILLSIGIFFASYCVLIVPGWDTTYEDCVADLIESGKYNDNVEVYDETNMYVYVEKDKTTHLIFEPYDEKKGVVYTKDDSIIIPYSDIENGYYNYCLILREK